jgi:hypothetical protein
VGPTAYLAESNDLLHALDVSDPTAPALIGSLPVEGWATDLELVGEHLVRLARHGDSHSWTAWLQCPDVVPTVVTAFAAEATAGGVRVRWRLSGGDPAAVALTRIDGGGETAVAFTHGGDGSYEAFDGRTVGDDPRRTYVLALAGQEVGRQSIELAAPTRPLTLRVAPNPFNPSVVIAYELPRASTVDVVVYEATGRRVRKLVAGAVEAAGRHTRRWDGRDAAGRDLASGTYLIRVTTGNDVVSCKAVLLR